MRVRLDEQAARSRPESLAASDKMRWKDHDPAHCCVASTRFNLQAAQACGTKSPRGRGALVSLTDSVSQKANNMHHRRSLNVLAVAACVALLAACGGGGDDADDAPPPLITTKEQVLAVLDAAGYGPASVDFASTATGIVESAMVHLAQGAGTTQDCVNDNATPGSVTYAIDDADGSLNASVGDTLTVTLTACPISGLPPLTGLVTYRLTQVATLGGYINGSGIGGVAGDFNFGDVRVDGHAVAGALRVARAFELRNGVRTFVGSESAPLITLTNAANMVTEIRNLDRAITRDPMFNIIGKRSSAFSAAVPSAGNLAFTTSITQALSFPEEENPNQAITGAFRMSNAGVELVATLDAEGISVAVDNGVDGSVEQTIRFTYDEL